LSVILRVVFDVRPFRIPSESMLPTFEVGDRFAQTGTSSPERGDIVTFNPCARARPRDRWTSSSSTGWSRSAGTG
jgi:signal peptidase I